MQKDESIQDLVSMAAARQARARKITLVYTAVAFIALGGWFSYAFYKIDKIDKNAIEKKKEAERLSREIDNLNQTKNGVERELERRKEDLLKLQLSETAAKPVEKPIEPKVKATAPAREIVGYAYYGIGAGNGNWSERYFKKDAGGAADMPRVGDTISSISLVNMREGYITYNPDKGWVNQPARGVIKPKQRFEVLEVKAIAESFIWVKIKKVSS